MNGELLPGIQCIRVWGSDARMWGILGGIWGPQIAESPFGGPIGWGTYWQLAKAEHFLMANHGI